MKHLTIAFPEQSILIELQRKLDPDFDGICQDFEELSGTMTQLKSEVDEYSADRIVDISVSLTGLKQEILEIVRKLG